MCDEMFPYSKRGLEEEGWWMNHFMPCVLSAWRTVWTLCCDCPCGAGWLRSLLCLYPKFCRWKMVLLQRLQCLLGEEHHPNCFLPYISYLYYILNPELDGSPRSGKPHYGPVLCVWDLLWAWKLFSAWSAHLVYSSLSPLSSVSRFLVF